ncbi:MAG: DUF84 family protein [Crenarchaeota archaeon]|nr:DUF84 family protein [Thermoproteota archaeon]
MGRTINIYVGTENPAKIIGIEKAFRLIGEPNTHTVRVEDLKPQPVGINEIVYGAAKRAVISYKKCISRDCFAVGLEAGIISLSTGYCHSGQIAVIIHDDKYSIGTSLFFPLPDKHCKDLIGGKELADIMARESGLSSIRRNIGAVGYYTYGYITRIELSYQATLSALIPFINRDSFELLPDIRKLEEILKIQ